MIKVYSVSILVFLSLTSWFAQSQTPFESEISFTRYLIDNYEYDNARLILKKLATFNNLSKSQNDSVNYYLGWISYNKKNIDTSILYLNQVSTESPFYLKSHFYSAFNHAYLRKFHDASSILKHIELDSSSEFQKLKNYELAAVSFLERDYANSEKYISKFDGNYFPVALEEKSLVSYYAKINHYKSKSQWLAGTMSAIIPGSGKYYTGYRGQGVTAFVTVLSLAAVATEAYIRGGVKSFPFIAGSTVFSFFYVGNIWGSVNSVKKRDETFYKELERNVLLDIHVPLRRAFN